MLLKIEKTMSGLKVCKGESMKTRISKGMIRESYEHLALLGILVFFKIFRVARGMGRSHRLGTETVDDHVKR